MTKKDVSINKSKNQGSTAREKQQLMHTSTRECSWRAALPDDVIRQTLGPSPGMESGKPWQALFGAGLLAEQHNCSLVTVSKAGCGPASPQQPIIFLLPPIESTSQEQEKFKLLFCRDIGKKGIYCLHFLGQEAYNGLWTFLFIFFWRRAPGLQHNT